MNWKTIGIKVLGLGLVFLALILLITQQLYGWMPVTQDTDAIILTMLMIVLIASGFLALGGNWNERFWLFVNVFAWCFILPFILGGFTMVVFTWTGSELGLIVDIGPFDFDLTFLQIFISWIIPVATLLATLVSIKIVSDAYNRNWVLGLVLALITYMFFVATFIH